MNKESNIQNSISALLEKIGITAEKIEEKEIAGQTLYSIVVSEDDSMVLQSHSGEVVRAISMLVSRIVENETGERGRITIDINGYQYNKIDAIVSAAQVQADRAKELKYDVELQPTNAYERMLVHAHLAQDSQLETGSIGEGPERRVVIKWVG